LYPLLPRKIGQAIYFVSCVDDILRPFCYTDTVGVQPLPFEAQPFGDLFTPLPIFQSSQESFKPEDFSVGLSHTSQTQVQIQSLIYGGSLQRELFHDDQEPAEALLTILQ
jgi:hypothetical protein